MLFDTSYTDKKITKKINDAVGKPFSFKERWKLKGIGSKRMVITDISDEYRKHLKANHYETKANIELRPGGILIHFRDKLQTMTWVMPYESMKLNLSNGLILQSDGKFIHFRKEDIDNKFLEKLTDQLQLIH